MKYLLLILLIPFTVSAWWETFLYDIDEMNDLNEYVVEQSTNDVYSIDSITETFYLSWCRVTQDSNEHIQPNRWWMYATDIACIKGVSFDVRAPKIVESYVVKRIWVDKLLWNYIVIWWWEYEIVFWHTQTKLMVWDIVLEWAIIWNTDKSWASSAIHVHIELWKWKTNMRFNFETVNEKSEQLLRYRNRLDDWWFYFTHYHLGDPNQNDAAPCNWASGKDLCKLLKQWYQSIAFTSDKRKEYWLSFWDKVNLECKDPKSSWIYYVEDEMNKRYRQNNCILKNWYCIKWDIATFAGEYPKSGVCKITKL